MITKMLKKPMQSAYLVKNVLPNYTEKHSASNNSDGQTRSFLTISESFRTRRVISMALKDHNDFQDLEI